MFVLYPTFAKIQSMRDINRQARSLLVFCCHLPKPKPYSGHSTTQWRHISPWEALTRLGRCRISVRHRVRPSTPLLTRRYCVFLFFFLFFGFTPTQFRFTLIRPESYRFGRRLKQSKKGQNRQSNITDDTTKLY